MLEAILVGIIDAFLLRKTMQFCSGVDTSPSCGSAASSWRKRAGPREQRQIGQERGQDRQVGGRKGNDPSRAQKPFCPSYAPQPFAMFDDSNQYDGRLNC